MDRPTTTTTFIYKAHLTQYKLIQSADDKGEHSKALAQPQKKPDHPLICSDFGTYLKASDLKI